MKKILILFTAVQLIFASRISADKEKIKPDVVIKTEYGKIFIRLFDNTPIHRDNFIKLSKEKFYNGTVFHRVIKGFMIQGGDPWSKDTTKRADWGNGGPGYDLDAEILPDYYHKRGVLAAAREGDDINPLRMSSGSQFYIVVGRVLTDEQLEKFQKRVQDAGIKDFEYTAEQREFYKTTGGAPWLDQQYTIFGEVIDGMEVVDKIAALQAEGSDKPIQEIKLKVKAFAKK